MGRKEIMKVSFCTQLDRIEKIYLFNIINFKSDVYNRPFIETYSDEGSENEDSEIDPNLDQVRK